MFSNGVSKQYQQKASLPPSLIDPDDANPSHCHRRRQPSAAIEASFSRRRPGQPPVGTLQRQRGPRGSEHEKVIWPRGGNFLKIETKSILQSCLELSEVLIPKCAHAKSKIYQITSPATYEPKSVSVRGSCPGSALLLTTLKAARRVQPVRGKTGRYSAQFCGSRLQAAAPNPSRQPEGWHDLWRQWPPSVP